MIDPYGSNVLGDDPHLQRRPASRQVPVARGMVVEDATSGWVGAAVRLETVGGMRVVSLEDRRGRIKAFNLGPGFLIDGEPVELVAPQRPAQAPSRKLTASGSYAVANHQARVARPSRIWVEGLHDAELVEKVWGDDLRVEGVVVEVLEGVDNLDAVLRDFAPSAQARAGVLVDHFVAGSKETRLVADVLARLGTASAHVLVLGHPYVDVWQAVKPERVGLSSWPEVPRGTDIKYGTLTALGWPAQSQADVARGWKRILGRVSSYRDISPALMGRMEELIDFVTAV